MTLLRTAVETTTALYTLVATQWRGPHRLDIVVVLAVVHGLLDLPGRATHCFSPPPIPSPISLVVSEDVKHHDYLTNLMGRKNISLTLLTASFSAMKA